MKIDGKTELYALIGFPAKHTLSPAMHNKAFEYLGLNAVYLAFEVESKALKSVVSAFKSMGIRGMNVTVPHKEHIIKYLDQVEKEAALIGAVNAIVNVGGKFKGYNTDGKGFIKSFLEEFSVPIKHGKYFIMGSGGAARAVSFALALNGAGRIIICDEIDEKAVNLAKDLSKNTTSEIIAVRKEEKAIRSLMWDCEAFINATPRGMKQSDPLPIKADLIHSGLCVYDLIYNPKETKLLKEAKRRGARTANGLGMLLHQGTNSFSIWTGKKAPVFVMKKALELAIGF